jgi:hypothetical protein
MKLQIEGQRLRFRISEAELKRLLDGVTVTDTSRLSPMREMQRRLRLGEGHEVMLDWSAEAIELRLPRSAVEAYVEGLPRRDALSVSVGEGALALQLDFEVDVRDSVRTRRPRKSADA